VDVENLRRLTLHVRFPLPESQLAAHFHEACRILCGAEFNAARVEVGSNSRLLEERHGIGRIADELAVSEGIESFAAASLARSAAPSGDARTGQGIVTLRRRHDSRI